MFFTGQTNLYVADVERSVRFYRDGFGFQETFRTPKDGVPEHVEVRLDTFLLGFNSIRAAREVHGLSPGSGSPQAELVIWTDDVDAAFADLVEKHDATVLVPPHDFGDSLRTGWIADPDGNPVGITMRRA